MTARHLLAPPSSPLGALIAEAIGAHLHPFQEAPSLAQHPWVALLLPAHATPDALPSLHAAHQALDVLAHVPGVVISHGDVYDTSLTGLRRESDPPDAADTFGLGLAAAEQRAHGRPVVRIPLPLLNIPETAHLSWLREGSSSLPNGALQVCTLDEITEVILRPDLPSLLHLASGPVPTEALAEVLERPLAHRPGTTTALGPYGPGWDRLRSDWSELWGRPDGLLTPRRTHIPQLLAFAQTVPH